MGPLKGIKVVELAQIMAGPTCGMLLADMGADVIKVEKLPGGDDTRSYTEPSIAGESAAFMMLNRNKRGMAVNLKKPGGLEVVKRLLADADVVTENYRKGTLEKLGLVNRIPDPDDGRAQLLVAEPEARAKVDAYRKRAHARMSAILSEWTADDISTFARSLARLNDAAEQMP